MICEVSHFSRSLHEDGEKEGHCVTLLFQKPAIVKGKTIPYQLFLGSFKCLWLQMGTSTHICVTVILSNLLSFHVV